MKRDSLIRFFSHCEMTYADQVDAATCHGDARRNPDLTSLIWHDKLRNGVWPRQWTIWIIVFWMALMIVRPWEKLIPTLAAFHVERWYAIFAIGVVLLSGSFRTLRSFQTTGVICWAVGLSLSTLFSIDTMTSWEHLYVYITTFAFYFMLVSVIRTPYQLVFLIGSFVTVTAVYLGKCQWEYFIHGGWHFSMGVRRLSGIDLTYAHPNAVACTAVLPIPFIFFLWAVRSHITATWPSSLRRLLPWGLGLSLWLTLSSVVLTNSRSGLLGAILAMVLWMMGQGLVDKSRKRMICAVIILAVGWILMPADSKGRFRNIWDPEAGPSAKSAHMSAEGRVAGLEQGLEMFRRFPLTGVGIGNFLPYRVAFLDGTPLVAHNMIGAILGESGLVGGVTFAIFVSGTFVNCARLKRLSAVSSRADVRYLRAAGIAARNSAILILFLGMFGDMQGRIQLYWVAAFCLLAYELAVPSSSKSPISPIQEESQPTHRSSRSAHTRKPGGTDLH